MNGRQRILTASLLLSTILFGQTAPADLLRKADRAYRDQNIPEAIRLFEQALREDSSLTPARMMLGIIHAQQNQVKKAVQQFQAVIEAEPQNAHAHFFLARLAQAQSDWASAAKHYRAASENDHPDRQSVAIGMAAAEAQLGRPAAGLAKLADLEKPTDKRKASAYHAATAIAHRRLHNPQSAIESFRRAIEADPLNPALHEQLIETLIATGDYSLALSEAIRAQRQFPDHSGIQYQFGIGGFYIRESPFTSLALRNLEDIAPQDPRSSVLEALTQIKGERSQAALGVLREAVEANVPQSRLFLGMTLAETEEFREADEVLQQAGNEIFDGNFHLTQGRILIAQGRIHEALSSLRQAEAYMPTHPEVQLQLSRAYEEAGDLTKANQHKTKWEQLGAMQDTEF